MKNRKVYEICSDCGIGFILGENGIFVDDGLLKCDGCAGVSRDLNGYAWLVGEESHLYEDVESGEIMEVSREVAFGVTR